MQGLSRRPPPPPVGSTISMYDIKVKVEDVPVIVVPVTFATPVTSVSAVTSIAPVTYVDPSPHSSPTLSVPSVPAMSVECKAGPPAQSTPTQSPMQDPRSGQSLRNKSVGFGLAYGSDASSDESDDEELAAPFIPRVCRILLETPTDAEDAASTVDPAPIVEDVSTEQPWTPYDFEWKEFPNPPIPPELRRERFSATNVGPTAPCVDPYDIFTGIWDRRIMEHIAQETNRYAQQLATQLLNDHNLHPHSRISRWRDTTPDELYVYFAIVLAIGVVVKTRSEEYWATSHDVFYTPGFTAHMSFNRFHLLTKCLHFNNNDDMCAMKLDYGDAKLYKIEPIVSHLNRKFAAMYTPSQNIALDESLLQWKGWLDINQLIPNKTATVGIKTYEICESQTGYLWRFEIHTNKKSPPQQPEDPMNSSTSTVVLRLTHGLEGKGYTLWMDNYYNSPCLARRLKAIGFDCVGTLRTNRKFVPQALHSLSKDKMRPGNVTGLTSGDVDVMVWRDHNKVSMISTYHGNAAAEVNGTTKPILILDYNIMMGGVDKKDQMLAMFPVERKRTRVWYKKLFRRLLNASILNSYIIHRHSSSSTSTSLTHRSFRMALIRSLLSKHCPSVSVPTAIVLKCPYRSDSFDISHRLSEHPFSDHRRLRRQCVECKKRVRTFCVGCSKTVCMEPCFFNLHT